MASDSATTDPAPPGKIVEELWPTEVSLPTDIYAEATFRVPVDKEKTEESIEIKPAHEYVVEWKSPQKMIITPKTNWRPGIRVRLRLTAITTTGDSEPREWSFRTAVPEPKWVTPGKGQPVVFTFDDGSRTPRKALELLETLRELQIRAILFPSGIWLEMIPEFAALAREDGHLVCNHTYSHRDLTKLADTDIEREIQRGAGTNLCDLLRPPYGATDRRIESIIKKTGNRQYLWDIDTRDWDDAGEHDIVNFVMQEVKPGAVILMHMHGASTQKALPRLVKQLKKADYTIDWAKPESAVDGKASTSPSDVLMPLLKNRQIPATANSR